MESCICVRCFAWLQSMLMLHGSAWVAPPLLWSCVSVRLRLRRRHAGRCVARSFQRVVSNNPRTER
eukprot:7063881-Prymnesium_polylepis.1